MENNAHKILIVDDNDKNIQVLANFLIEENYDVDYALNGFDALDLINSEDFTLILLDIMMPEMDGFEVCKRIKEREKKNEIPVIFLTARTDIDSIEKAFEHGGQDYLTKPFNSNELLARVKTHIELKTNRDKLKNTNKWLEKKVAERTAELEQSMAILESKNNELEQFAYISSHDLQEPLRTVSSFVELLDQEYRGKFDDNADIYIRFILESTNRMRNLIHGLLEYSILGKGRAAERVDCHEILRLVLEDFQVVISESQGEIESGPLPTLNAYPIELKQLFGNLIGNALKYCREGVSPIINISSRKQDDTWEFKFKDNGIGIDEKFYETIFIIFQRLHNKQDYEGTGIGLAQCRKIVELHNGKIWVESIRDKGSEFYFTIKM